LESRKITSSTNNCSFVKYAKLYCHHSRQTTFSSQPPPRSAFNPTAPPPPAVAGTPYITRPAKLRRPHRYAYAAANHQIKSAAQGKQPTRPPSEHEAKSPARSRGAAPTKREISPPRRRFPQAREERPRRSGRSSSPPANAGGDGRGKFPSVSAPPGCG
jgi:hypothetical protein